MDAELVQELKRQGLGTVEVDNVSTDDILAMIIADKKPDNLAA